MRLMNYGAGPLGSLLLPILAANRGSARDPSVARRSPGRANAVGPVSRYDIGYRSDRFTRTP